MKTKLMTALTALGYFMSVSPNLSVAQRPSGWFIYKPPSQTCGPANSTPPIFMEGVRRDEHVDPEADDVTDEITGKVTATDIHWPDPYRDQMELHVRMFRKLADCDAYAATRRDDPHRYDN
jgi:hypothetical protein